MRWSEIRMLASRLGVVTLPCREFMLADRRRMGEQGKAKVSKIPRPD